MENLSELANLVAEHKWFAVAALIIGLAIRLLKSDGPIPINIPPRWRPWLALWLGVLAGMVEKLSTGTPWKPALLWGLGAAVTAMLGHTLVIQSVRGGRELGESKQSFKLRSMPPPPMMPSSMPAYPESAVPPATTSSPRSEEVTPIDRPRKS